MKHILFVLLMVLALALVGCGQPAPEPEPVPVPEPAPVVEPEPVPVVEPAPPVATEGVEEDTSKPSGLEAVAIEGSDVRLTKGGYDPSAVTISKGAKLRFIVGDGMGHSVNCIGPDNSQVFRSGTLIEGRTESAEYVFEAEGEYSCLDVTVGRRLTVTVE